MVLLEHLCHQAVVLPQVQLAVLRGHNTGGIYEGQGEHNHRMARKSSDLTIYVIQVLIKIRPNTFSRTLATVLENCKPIDEKRCDVI
jgi:hypothetical protein